MTHDLRMRIGHWEHAGPTIYNRAAPKLKRRSSVKRSGAHPGPLTSAFAGHRRGCHTLTQLTLRSGRAHTYQTNCTFSVGNYDFGVSSITVSLPLMNGGAGPS